MTPVRQPAAHSTIPRRAHRHAVGTRPRTQPCMRGGRLNQLHVRRVNICRRTKTHARPALRGILARAAHGHTMVPNMAAHNARAQHTRVLARRHVHRAHRHIHTTNRPARPKLNNARFRPAPGTILRPPMAEKRTVHTVIIAPAQLLFRMVRPVVRLHAQTRFKINRQNGQIIIMMLQKCHWIVHGGPVDTVAALLTTVL